jgi:hypothetical protein
MKTFISLLALAMFAAAAPADTLRLKNGAVVEGTYMGGDSREVKFLRTDGGVRSYRVSDIEQVTFGDAGAGTTAAAPISPSPKGTTTKGTTTASSGVTIPANTVVTIRTIDSINSDINGAGEKFRASLDTDLLVAGRVVAARGSDVMVRIARVQEAGRVTGREEIALELASITVDGREHNVVTNFAEMQSRGQTGQTARRAGVGAAGGAILGGIIGGGRGAAIGAGVGAGAGTVYSGTRGVNIEVPSESLLTFTLREPVQL